MASRARPRTRAKGSRHRTEPHAVAARVGARIKRFRLASDFTFDAFVEETGLGRGYISELERGLIVPTVGALERVASALEVTLADLVLGETDREKLFDELRGAPAAHVRELRDRVRVRAPELPIPEIVKRPETTKRKPR